MKTYLVTAQIILSIMLILVILLQGRGTGLSSGFGGGGEFYSSRRGIESVLLKVTIFLIILFLTSSIANILVK